MKRVILALLLSLIMAGPALAQDASRTLGGVPANPDPANPRSKSIFIYQLGPEQSRDDAISVINNTQAQKTIKLYAADGLATNTGSLSCEQEVENRDGVGGWIKLELAEITLEPFGRQNVPFKITAPAELAPGEHNGCIVIQEKTAGPEIQEGAIALNFRSAIRVAVTAPGDVSKKISLEKFGIDWSWWRQVYLLSLKNDGNASADVKATVELTGLFGGQAFTAGGEYPVLAKNSLNLSFADDEPPFWGGFYWAEATAQYDPRPGVFGVAESGELRTLKSGAKLVFILPAWPVLVGLAIIILLLLWVWYRHRQRDRALETWVEHGVEEDETIVSIAKRHNISWRRLAAVNKVRPPYIIRKGQRLRVPPRN